jgi:hypothetical protein
LVTEASALSGVGHSLTGPLGGIENNPSAGPTFFLASKCVDEKNDLVPLVNKLGTALNNDEKIAIILIGAVLAL